MRAQISVIKFDQAQWQAIRYLLAWMFSTHRELPIGVLRDIVETQFDGSLSQLRYFVRRLLRNDAYLLIEDAKTLHCTTKEILENTAVPNSEIELAIDLLVSEVDAFELESDPAHGAFVAVKRTKRS